MNSFSALGAETDVWWAGQEVIFIYLFIGFIKTHLLPTGLGLPTEKQLSQLKQLVSKGTKLK